MKNQIIKTFGEDYLPADLDQIPGEVNIVRVLSVNYLHIRFKNGDDIYLTKYSLPNYKILMPENYWTDKKWFKNNSERLDGTSSIYRIKTKKIAGKHKEIVLKWNRMGQDIPGERDNDNLLHAEFNSPFEEFALLEELRNTRYESPGIIRTQLPLAIYVPSKNVQFWQTGRKEHKIHKKIKNHFDIKLDMNRSYAVIFGWIKGFDAVEVNKKGLLDKKALGRLTLKVENDMKKKGFIIIDRKPHHIIVKVNKDNKLIQDKKENILYAVIDYELLGRTPEREKNTRNIKREQYLEKQAHRYKVNIKDNKFPPNLFPIEILGVQYVFGHIESTNGMLWVVGKDPILYDYFLPERWENNPKIKLSDIHEIYHAITKENINIVWKVSRVGERPNKKYLKGDKRRILKYGYNSPFEEVNIAIELSKKRVRTIYPRAIYMTGKKITDSNLIFDNSRYKSHKHFITPNGIPILNNNNSYIIIWGYWNGPDEKLVKEDKNYYKPIDVFQAYQNEIIDHDQFNTLIKRKKEKLTEAGFEDLNFKSSHLLLSLDQNGSLIIDDSGMPEERICNFELIRRLEKQL